MIDKIVEIIFIIGFVFIIMVILCTVYKITHNIDGFTIVLEGENVEKLKMIKKETYIEPEAYCKKIIEEHLRSK